MLPVLFSAVTYFSVVFNSLPAEHWGRAPAQKQWTSLLANGKVARTSKSHCSLWCFSAASTNSVSVQVKWLPSLGQWCTIIRRQWYMGSPWHMLHLWGLKMQLSHSSWELCILACVKFVKTLIFLKERKNVILASLSTPTSKVLPVSEPLGKSIAWTLAFPFGSLGLSFVRCAFIRTPFSRRPTLRLVRLWEEDVSKCLYSVSHLNMEVQASFSW